MKKQMRQAVALYQSFREKKPRKVATVHVKVPAIVACMGHVEFIGYRTTHGKKLTLYKHDFAPGSRPLLCVSADGRQLMLLGGRYKWTDRGIVDRDAKGKEIENDSHGLPITDPWDERTPALLRRQANARGRYDTYAGWKRGMKEAAKKRGETVSFVGDKDIDEAQVMRQWQGKLQPVAIGEWDGATGIKFFDR